MLCGPMMVAPFLPRIGSGMIPVESGVHKTSSGLAVEVVVGLGVAVVDMVLVTEVVGLTEDVASEPAEGAAEAEVPVAGAAMTP
jgi:hypothetical protein